MKLSKYVAVYLFLLLTAISCSEPTMVEHMENAHMKSAFLEKKAVQFDFDLIFGGKQRLLGKITLLTHSGEGRIDYSNGNVVIFNGNKVYCSPALKDNLKGVRFDAYTWAYFFLFPYKMSDEGTVWQMQDAVEMSGEKFDKGRLSFKGEIGDAPDDWYLVYSNPENHLLGGLTYIVTSGKTLEEAEKDPHAIRYFDYENVDGIPISTNWKFYNWDSSNNTFADQLGEAKLSDIQFVVPEDSFFEPTDNLIDVMN